MRVWDWNWMVCVTNGKNCTTKFLMLFASLYGYMIELLKLDMYVFVNALLNLLSKVSRALVNV